jgi:hypothetical protein|tara:strand:- start:692 stop:883 length:192 start_codon:yes stop_codon:yes gene_type:complete
MLDIIKNRKLISMVLGILAVSLFYITCLNDNGNVVIEQDPEEEKNTPDPSINSFNASDWILYK